MSAHRILPLTTTVTIDPNTSQYLIVPAFLSFPLSSTSFLVTPRICNLRRVTRKEDFFESAKRRGRDNRCNHATCEHVATWSARGIYCGWQGPSLRNCGSGVPATPSRLATTHRLAIEHVALRRNAHGIGVPCHATHINLRRICGAPVDELWFWSASHTFYIRPIP